MGVLNKIQLMPIVVLATSCAQARSSTQSPIDSCSTGCTHFTPTKILPFEHIVTLAKDILANQNLNFKIVVATSNNWTYYGEQEQNVQSSYAD